MSATSIAAEVEGVGVGGGVVSLSVLKFVCMAVVPEGSLF